MLPQKLYSFVFRASGWHQLGAAVLSILLFLAGTIPLDIQRRIVNTATERGSYRTIAFLVLAYMALALTEGLLKLVLNIYRSWIGEAAVRWLRQRVFEASDTQLTENEASTTEGVQLSIILAEADPVGGFVGTSISEPLLQIGLLAAVCGYLVYLQPLMTVIIATIFLPQSGFVPFMQAAINRRVQKRIGIMRNISEDIVQSGRALDTDGLQRSRIQDVFRINMSIYKIKFAMNFMMNLMTQMGYVGIFALGGYYVVTGKTEVGTVVAFVSGLSKINDPWGDLINWYRDLKVTQVKYDLIHSSAKIGAIAIGGRDATG
ncbi:ABC transporter transmembrane domain-containing protein [Rhizobium calliandrae]|uniref:ABC transporter transmembrane domain-containing protein n=1 Tax=Rhizobium calliandrae TaxID=1312182 RepID=A0ABT7KQ29_9HYPH|nr:ABC transporter transmembrane domain-containing protein [Rhizobium calliandrae]MDL2410727.1 ABC transporter transmembrane domain-containing protein [Rhizobium calliandrae]